MGGAEIKERVILNKYEASIDEQIEVREALFFFSFWKRKELDENESDQVFVLCVSEQFWYRIEQHEIRSR